MNETKQTQININPKDLDNVVCEKCNSPYFKEVKIIKKMSALISPSGREEILPLDFIRCDDCGHVNEEHKSLVEKE